MKINMADQGNRREVYYFARGFGSKVLQEYISSTRKHEIVRETRPKNAGILSPEKCHSLRLKMLLHS